MQKRKLLDEVRIKRATEETTFSPFPTASFDATSAKIAVQNANRTLHNLEEYTGKMRVPFSRLLGIRGVSVAVSAVLVSEVANSFIWLWENPHQDGYPDLLPNTPALSTYITSVLAANQWTDKSAWTDPGLGGIEVKVTSGSVPTKKAKPDVGIERSSLVNRFDWKAHHRQTNNLFGATWDFIDGVPQITSAFYSNELVPDDWGKVVVPKDNGSRTTSVSVMKRSGLDKMAAGWMVRSSDQALQDALKRAKMWV